MLCSLKVILRYKIKYLVLLVSWTLALFILKPQKLKTPNITSLVNNAAANAKNTEINIKILDITSLTKTTVLNSKAMKVTKNVVIKVNVAISFDLRKWNKKWPDKFKVFKAILTI